MLATGALLPWLFDYAGSAAWPWAWIGSGGICLPLSIAAIIAMRTIAEPSARGGKDAWTWHPCLPDFTAYFLFGLHYGRVEVRRDGEECGSLGSALWSASL